MDSKRKKFVTSFCPRGRLKKKSLGELRKALEVSAWPHYGNGLWNESWAVFFGEFARAVQPYAHYTPLLQGWQLASPGGQQLTRSSDGQLMFIARMGVNTYDPIKATRITLLHCLLTWVIARIVIANNNHGSIDKSRVNELGIEIANSELLGGGSFTWHQEFWPHMFDAPKPVDTIAPLSRRTE